METSASVSGAAFAGASGFESGAGPLPGSGGAGHDLWMRQVRRTDDDRRFVFERRVVPAPGPENVLVRVGASVVADWERLILPRRRSAGGRPVVGGYQIAGWVAQTGRLVSGWEPGEPVAVFGGWGCGTCRACLDGEEQMCAMRRWPGVDVDGGHADYVLVPAARHLVRSGDLDPVDVAPIAAALPTYRAIRHHEASFRPGSVVVVLGVGAHGHLAIQLLRTLTDTTVVAVDERADRRRLAVDLGAAVAIDPTADDAVAEIDLLSGGERATVVFDFRVTPDSLVAGASVAGRSATVVTLGLDGPTELPRLVPPRELTLSVGVWGNRMEFSDVVALARSGRIAARRRAWSLDEIAAADDAERASPGMPCAVVVP